MEFDTRVHLKDPKTGKPSGHQPYDLHIVQGMHFYNRPPKSDGWFAADSSKLKVADLPAHLQNLHKKKVVAAAFESEDQEEKKDTDSLKEEKTAVKK